MNRLDHQDKERYWKISQVRSSAHYFAEGAEKAFRHRLGHLAESGTEGAFPALGSVFYLTGDLLDELEKSFDQVLFERAMAWISCRKTSRRRNRAREAAYKKVCSIRQFAHSQTGGRSDRDLALRGPTPRDPEKLAGWGEILRDRLPDLDLPEEARALAAAMAKKLAPLVRELNEAIEEAQLASQDQRLAQAEVERVRKEVDHELDKATGFLRSTLEFAGQDYLASRVLGKRRGRPRKSVRRKTAATLQEATAGRRKIDSAPQPASGAGRKIDSAPQPASGAGRKFDSEVETDVPGAFEELREIEEAPNEACTASKEIVEGPSEACTALQKIAEGPCKPCTELSQDAEVASFQQDTPRTTRQHRRRVASALLRASKRILPSAWMGRIVTAARSRRRAS